MFHSRKLTDQAVSARAIGLQRRRHLRGLPGIDARIVRTGRDHHRGVLPTRNHVLDGARGIEVLEPGLRANRTELRDVRRTVRTAHRGAAILRNLRVGFIFPSVCVSGGTEEGILSIMKMNADSPSRTPRLVT
jgi:hypothetical protein